VGITEPSYKGHRYPSKIIDHCVWLYFRFTLSLRDIEELMLERGVVVSYETVRRWCAKFGHAYANRLRHRCARPGDTWHLDEVFVRINGDRSYLWRAVDQDGIVLDVLVQSRRNAKAAKRFFRKLLKGLRYAPRVLITDKLASYQVAQTTPIEVRAPGLVVRAGGPVVNGVIEARLRTWRASTVGFLPDATCRASAGLDRQSPNLRQTDWAKGDLAARPALLAGDGRNADYEARAGY
jgi:transposase-like protein